MRQWSKDLIHSYRAGDQLRSRSKHSASLLSIVLFSCLGLMIMGPFVSGVLSASFGTNLGSFNGVTAFSNGSAGHYSGVSNTVNGIYTGIKWQCVEYVRRYYLIVFGMDLGSLYRGNANTWYDNASQMGLSRYPNGSTTAPQVGDVITSRGGSFGHVAIIRSVTSNQVCTIQQNFSNETSDTNRCLSLSVSGGTYTVGGFNSSYPIQGWLRKPGTPIPPACTGGTSESYRVNGGPPLHPNGSLIFERNTTTVYLVQNGQKRPISSPDVLHHLYIGENGEFDFSDVITIASDEMNRYPVGAGVFDSLPSNGRSQPDGRLIRQVGGTEVSIVTNNGRRRPFTTENTFLGLGYKFCGVVEVSDYNSYPVESVVAGLEPLPTITSSIVLSPVGPHAVNQNITASFSITNKGNITITLSQLLAGGRLSGGAVADFPSDTNVTLLPNQTYNYQRSRSFGSPGTFQFFPALQHQDGTWKISLNDEIGVAPGVVSIITAVVNSGPTAPPNNNFTSAQTISGPLGTVNGANVGANKESGEPNHAGNSGGASVWYRWTAPATSTVTFATTGSNFDTLLASYTGSSVNSLTLIASNDDFGSSLQSAITFGAQNGVTYYIALDGFNGATGSSVLGWGQIPPVPTTNPATNVTTNSFTANWSSSIGAGGYLLDVSISSMFSSFVTGYSNLDVGNVTSRNITGLSASTTYYYRVRGYNSAGTSGNSGTTSVTTTPNTPPAPTANAATSVTSTSFTSNWSSSIGSTGYRLDVSTSISFGSFVTGYNNLDVSNVLSRSVSGLAANTTYYYRVRANNTGGTSGNSNVISVTTSSTTTQTLTVASSNPSSGASITISPNDNSGFGSGTTQFTRTYNLDTTVNLTAPGTAGGNLFQKWQRDGLDLTTNQSTSVLMDAHHTMTAVYISPPVLQFSQATYPVGEADLRVNLTVTRTGDTIGAASVDFTTNDVAGLQNCNIFNSIASPRCDFIVQTGRVSFAVGETSKTFSIAIINDLYQEGTETFTVSLSNPAGASLGAQANAMVMIADNDTTTGTNPIDQTAFFVRQQYLDFLGREPDPPGEAAWINTINNCPPNDTSCDRIHVSQLFFQSAEFQQRGYFVYRVYPVSFGRKPDYAEFVQDLASVSGFLSDAQLEAAKGAFIAQFTARPAFANTYNPLNNTQYVDTLLNTAGVTLANRQAMIDGLNAGALTRAQVLQQILESSEVASRYFNQAYAVMEYFGYLRRQPDAFYLDWIAYLNGGGTPRGMVTGFVNSAEYRQRFGP
jgi:hypothetical protein